MPPGTAVTALTVEPEQDAQPLRVTLHHGWKGHEERGCIVVVHKNVVRLTWDAREVLRCEPLVLWATDLGEDVQRGVGGQACQLDRERSVLCGISLRDMQCECRP